MKTNVRFLLAALLLAAASTEAAGARVLAYEQEAFGGNPPSFVEATPPSYTFSARRTATREVEIYLQGIGGGDRIIATLGAPLQQQLSPGPYEGAARSFIRGSAPGVDFNDTNTSGCLVVGGRFVVLELEFGPADAVTRFAANFEARCEGKGRIYGEVRFDSDIPLRSATVGSDNLPDAFALLAQSPVAAGAVVTSNTISIVGVNASVPVSIAGGEYSLNGAPFTAASGVAQNKDEIAVRLTASSVRGATTAATLTAGGQQATLSVKTYQPGMVLGGFAFRSDPEHYVGQGRTVLYLAPPHGIEALVSGPAQVTAIGPGVSYSVILSGPNVQPLQLGTYENTSPPINGVQPQLGFGGDGRGCTPLPGRFIVRDVAYGIDGQLTRLAVDFEHHCESNVDPDNTAWGEIRINTQVPFSALNGGSCATDDSDRDGAPDCVELGESLDPAVKDNDIFANARWFAMQQYRDFLGREGDAGGIAAWSGNIQSGVQSRGQVIETFFGSQEFQGTIAPVARLYFAYFLRIPDYGGLNFWIGYYRAGNSLDAISNAFAASSEFQANYGSLDNGQFVDLVYQNVLGRAPDAGGRAFWKNELDTGARTRGNVMLGFSESDEYRGASDSMVYVTMMYVGMLRRSPEQGGFDFWVGYRNAGNSGLALIDAFLKSQEYRSRFLP